MHKEQKVAVVTGGGTGIGKGCVLKFLEQGYKVMASGRRMDKLQELAEEARSEDLMLF